MKTNTQPVVDYRPTKGNEINNLPISMMNPHVIHRSKNSIMVAGLRNKYKIDRVSSFNPNLYFRAGHPEAL